MINLSDLSNKANLYYSVMFKNNQIPLLTQDQASRAFQLVVFLLLRYVSGVVSRPRCHLFLSSPHLLFIIGLIQFVCFLY